MSTPAGPRLPRTLGLRDLVLLKLVAIINVSLLPPVAGYGHAALGLWLIAFCLFFIPEAVAVLALARRYPGEGGIYLWTRRQFGDVHGFVSGWCYWMGNLFYFPMQLVYLAGVVAFALGDASGTLIGVKTFVFGIAVVWLVVATAANWVGLAVGKWIPNLGSIGTAATVLFIVSAAVWSLWSGTAVEVPAARGSLGDMTSALGVMCFAFMGLELASTMGDEMRSARRDLPRATIVAGVGTLAAYLAVTASLQRLVPSGDIGAIQGVIQAVAQGSVRFGAAWLATPLAVAMAVSIGGGLAAWYAGSMRIPFVAGFDRALPEWLGRVHPRWGSPYVALLVQGALAAMLMAATLVGSSVAEAYQVLLRASAIITLVLLCLLTFSSSVGVAGWRAIVYQPGGGTSDSPLPLAMGHVVGNNAVLYHLLITVGLFGLVASFHGLMLAAGRSTFEFGRVGFAPRFLGVVHQKFRTPANALLANMVTGIIILLSGKTAEVITIAVFGALTLYVFSMLALLRLRKNEPSLERPFKVPFYPVLPLVALFIAVVSLVAMVIFNTALAALYLLLMAGCYLLFKWFRRNR